MGNKEIYTLKYVALGFAFVIRNVFWLYIFHKNQIELSNTTIFPCHFPTTRVTWKKISPIHLLKKQLGSTSSSTCLNEEISENVISETVEYLKEAWSGYLVINIMVFLS